MEKTPSPPTMASIVGAAVDRSSLPEGPRKAQSKIIINTNSKRVEKPLRSEYVEKIKRSMAGLESLLFSISQMRDSQFKETYRERDGQHPITFHTEINHRLKIVSREVNLAVDLFESPAIEFEQN